MSYWDLKEFVWRSYKYSVDDVQKNDEKDDNELINEFNSDMFAFRPIVDDLTKFATSNKSILIGRKYQRFVDLKNQEFFYNQPMGDSK